MAHVVNWNRSITTCPFEDQWVDLWGRTWLYPLQFTGPGALCQSMKTVGGEIRYSSATKSWVTSSNRSASWTERTTWAAALSPSFRGRGHY
jgi:hypothetical protein